MDNITIAILILVVLCTGMFSWWLGFEMAELQFMPHLECDYLFDDLDYYDRAQKEWVNRCYQK